MLDRGIEIQLLRTLIIEPDLEMGAVLTSLVSSRGHEAGCVQQCSEAAHFLKQAPVDLLLIRLNHATATPVAEFLHALLQQTGVSQPTCLALTDDDEPTARIEAWLKRGFADVITVTRNQSHSLLRNRIAIAEHALMQTRTLQRTAASEIAAAQRYHHLFLNSPAATLIITARDGFIIEANPAAETILGIPRTDLVSRFLSLVLPDLFDHEDYDPQILKVHDAVRMAEVSHRRPDGSHRWLDVYLARIEWPTQAALVLRLQDISLLKERAARRQQDSRQDAATRVLQGVAIELSDALTTIRGNLELLSRIPPARAEARELLASAQLGCDTAESLARRSTQIARRQQGHDLHKHPQHLKPLLEKCIAFALLSGKCTPVLHVSDDLWPIEADETALSEALRALVENATHAMPQGGTLFVDACNLREPNTQPTQQAGIQIRLRDQGPGIPTEDLHHVFDPFYSTTGRRGMGLTLAAATIRAHGGRLTLTSVPGEGTTATVWLPVNIKHLLNHPPLPTDPTAPALKSPRSHPPDSTPPRPRILFMDDEIQIRVLVQKILTAHGFDVYCTNDGQEAIDAYRKAHAIGTPFHVLLMDLDVRGGMGGMEAIARLNTEFPTLKALLTTGYIDDALLDAHREHGFLGVIPKPFQIERLVSAVRKLSDINA